MALALAARPAAPGGCPGADGDSLRDSYSCQADDGSTSDRKREAAMLFSVAEGHLEDGSIEEALSSAVDALHVFREMDDLKGVADVTRIIIHAYRQMASVLRDQEDYKEGEDRLRTALAVAQEEMELFCSADDRRGQALMHLSIAELNIENRERDQSYDALDSAEDALNLFRELGDEKKEAAALFAMSRVYIKRNNFHFARRLGTEAVEAYKKVGDGKGEVEAWENLARTAAQEFCYDEALRCARKGLKLAQELGITKLEATLLFSIAEWSLLKGYAQNALQPARMALTSFQKLDDGRGHEVAAVSLIAEAHMQMNEKETALQVVRDALSTMREKDDLREVARCLLYLGVVHERSGQHEEATVALTEAVLTCQQMDFKRLESRLQETLAYVYASLKQPDEAKKCAKAAVDLLRELNLLEHECKGRLFIEARICVAVEDYAGAAQAADEGLKLARDIGDPKLEGQAMLAVCTCCLTIMDVPKAIKFGEQAADMFHEVGGNYRIDEAKTHQALCQCHLQEGDIDAALRASQKSEQLLAGFGDRRRLAQMKQNTASVFIAAGELEEAVRVATEALKICRAEDDMRGTLQSIFLIVDIQFNVLMNEMDTKSRRVQMQGIEKATRLAKEAIGLAIKLGDLAAESSGLCWTASLEVLHGKLPEAKQHADSALKQAKACGQRGTEAWAMSISGQILIVQRDLDGATTLLTEALAAALEAGNQGLQRTIEELLTEASGDRGRARSAPTVIEVPGGEPLPAGPPPGASSAPSGELYMAPDRELVKSFIMNLVTQMTGGSDEQIEADVPLMESGIDSLASVELRTQLQKEFRLNLPSTVMFNYPTISGMSDLLVEECTHKKIAWTM